MNELAQAKRVSEWNHFTAVEQQQRADKLEKQVWRFKRQRKIMFAAIAASLIAEAALIWFIL